MIVFLYYRNTTDRALKIFFLPGLSFKITAGIALGLLYKYYYQGGDTWALFEAGIKVKEVAFQSFSNFFDIFLINNYDRINDFSYAWIPSAFMVKFLAVINLFTGSNYWLSSIWLSLISFLSFWYLATRLYYQGVNKWLAVLPTLFFPSLVFWTSGILKESLAIGALAVILGVFLQSYPEKGLRNRNLLLAIIALVVLAILKYYIAALIIVAILTVALGRLILRQQGAWYVDFSFTILLFLLIATGVSQLHPNLWPSRILTVVYQNYMQYITISPTDNIISFNNLQPTITSFLLNAPQALFAGLYFPLLAGDLTILKIPVLIENWLLLTASVLAIYKFKCPKERKHRLLLWSGLLFVIIAAIFIAFTTPNLGTLVRYKSGYLLVILLLLLAGLFRGAKIYK